MNRRDRLKSAGGQMTFFIVILLAATWPAHGADQRFDLDYGKGEAQSLKVHNSDVIYIDKGEGPPVVFYHPSVDYRGWQMQVPAFAKGHRVIAFSFHIDEHSPMPADMSDPAMLTDALDRLESTLSLGPAHLVAHSMGGLQAMRLAASHPDLLRSLTVEEPGVDITGIKQTCSLDHPSPVELRVCNFQSVVGGPGYYASLPEPFKQFLLQGAQNEGKAVAAAMAAGIKPVPLPDACPIIATLTMPILFVRGAITPASFQARLDRHETCLPEHRTVVVPRATHWGHLDNPDAFNRAVLAFIGEH
jgi:pimeloyl-ACP methyl ester carboxylesterase